MLKETALANVHREMGAKMVDFSGWLMPVNYGSQIEEHHAVRKDAGIFDVSHMTVVDVASLAPENVQTNAKAFLSYLLANDVDRLKEDGKALYTAMLNETGGVIDDLIVYRQGESDYRLVVNCATRDKDLAWINKHAGSFEVEVVERASLAMIALQGPKANSVLTAVLKNDAVLDIKAFSAQEFRNKDANLFVARTGYTGEDGFEIILESDHAEAFWRMLVQHGAAPCGLGARDTLRLEAGMNLYGHEMNESISPLEANMAWTVVFENDRSFIGRSALEQQVAGGVSKKLVGLKLIDKGVIREGYKVFDGENEIGIVTSGSFSPTLAKAIGFARVALQTDKLPSELYVEVRNKKLKAEVVKPVFVRKGKVV